MAYIRLFLVLTLFVSAAAYAAPVSQKHFRLGCYVWWGQDESGKRLNKTELSEVPCNPLDDKAARANSEMLLGLQRSRSTVLVLGDKDLAVHLQVEDQCDRVQVQLFEKDNVVTAINVSTKESFSAIFPGTLNATDDDEPAVTLECGARKREKSNKID